MINESLINGVMINGLSGLNVGYVEIGGFTTSIEAHITEFSGVANVELSGFSTSISASGVESAQTANLGGFNTTFISYGGANANLTGFTSTFDISGTMDGYGVSNLNSFNTIVSAIGQQGAVGTANLNKSLNVNSISAYGGATANLSKFTTVISATGLSGVIGSANLVGFTTRINASAIADDYGVVIIRPPLISMLYGMVNLGGFNTQIVSKNKLVASNSIAYAMNINTTDTTQYTNYDFDYIIKLAGKYHGVKSDGLYLLEGVDDDGVAIDGKIKTSTMDFGTALHKRVPHIYLDSDNITRTSPYVEDILVGQYDSGFNGRRTKLPRGAKGRFWAFEVTNVNGSAMKLGSLEAYAQVLSRKV